MECIKKNCNSSCLSKKTKGERKGWVETACENIDYKLIWLKLGGDLSRHAQGIPFFQHTKLLGYKSWHIISPI